MAKLMKTLKAGFGVIRVNSALNRGFSTSHSLAMTTHSNNQDEASENDYSLQHLKYLLEDAQEELERSSDVIKNLKTELAEAQTELEKVSKKLHKALYPEVLRTWIALIEDYDGDGFQEAEKNTKEIDKEFTKRKWIYMLKKKHQGVNLYYVSEHLAESEDPSIEKFAENMAELKSVIYDKIGNAEFECSDCLPYQYNILDEKRFKDTIYILYERRKEVEREEAENDYYSD